MLLLVVGLVVIVLVILVVVFLSVRSMRAEEADDYPVRPALTSRSAAGRRDEPGYGHTRTRPPAQPYDDPGRDPDPRRLAAVPARTGSAVPQRRFGSLPRPRGHQHDEESSDWGGVSDEQYWAELSADKPLATTARSAQPAAAPTTPAPDTDPGTGGISGWQETATDTAWAPDAVGPAQPGTWADEDPLTSPSFAAPRTYSAGGDYLASRSWESDPGSDHEYQTSALEPLPGLPAPAAEPAGSWYSAPTPDPRPYAEPSYHDWPQDEGTGQGQHSWQAAEPEYGTGPGYELPGYDGSYPPTGYDQPGFDQPGYDQPAYDGAGYTGQHQAWDEPSHGWSETHGPGYEPYPGYDGERR
jgi:hypothetical protein